jgi:hypothetical protein
VHLAGLQRDAPEPGIDAAMILAEQLLREGE